MAVLRVALLQLAACGADPEANARKAEPFLRRAAAEGAALALLPELWSHGYSVLDPGDRAARDAWLAAATPRDGAWVRGFADRARALRMAIGVTYLERRPGAPRNTLTLFDDGGREVLSYAKLHLCPWGPPDTACAAGDELPVATLRTPAGPLRVGALICFDREFPEAARVLALGGAELLLVPNACDLRGDAAVGDARIAQLRGRAFENGVAIACANYAAPQYDGHSLAVGPDGAVLAIADEAEGVLLVDVDLDALRAWRRAEAGRNEARRPDRYGAITARLTSAPASARGRSG